MSVAEHSAAAVRPRRSPVPLVVQQHVDEAVQLRRVRSVLVRAPTPSIIASASCGSISVRRSCTDCVASPRASTSSR